MLTFQAHLHLNYPFIHWFFKRKRIYENWNCLPCFCSPVKLFISVQVLIKSTISVYFSGLLLFILSFKFSQGGSVFKRRKIRNCKKIWQAPTEWKVPTSKRLTMHVKRNYIAPNTKILDLIRIGEWNCCHGFTEWCTFLVTLSAEQTITCFLPAIL